MKRVLKWGLIGGGKGSQIGEAHRVAARLDGDYQLTAGALDIDPQRAKEFADELGIPSDRAYPNWQEMLVKESAHSDPIDLVTIATPNATHYEIAKAFLEAGFHVLCEKPLTLTVAEAKDLVALAKRAGKTNAVNFGYSGYPMVRQARAMIDQGELGKVRVIVAEFAHGSHADAADADNPRVRWRYDPVQAGVSSVLADAGVHALHMAGFVLGQSLYEISAHFDSCLAGRKLEDNALLSLRYSEGTIGHLWTSAVAVGQCHGLNLRIFGEKGGLRWSQEFPNQLYWTPLGETTRILERGADYLSPEAQIASRITVGHAEGMLGAFGNLYSDLYRKIVDPVAKPLYPTFDEGLEMVKAVHAAVDSSKEGGVWKRL